MIISHSRKFIFIKPRKVAGTSIEVALAQYCSPEDIITPNVSSDDIDASGSIDYARNDTGYYNHMSSERIRAKVGQHIWDTYYKCTIVRNPWDMLVSRYFWNKKNATPRKTIGEVLQEIMHTPTEFHLYGKLFFAFKRAVLREDIQPDDTFEDFLKKLPHNVSNTKYYFNAQGKPLCDFVIRYEHLQEDFNMLCTHLKLPETPLPQMKTKTRTSRDYKMFYTDDTRDWVARTFAQEIEYFGYRF